MARGRKAGMGRETSHDIIIHIVNMSLVSSQGGPLSMRMNDQAWYTLLYLRMSSVQNLFRLSFFLIDFFINVL